MNLLDRITPGEAHLPPSARTWARELHLHYGGPVLEIRDPNDCRGDPALCARHQYLVGESGHLFARRLPPAPLDMPDDETPWADDPAASAWRVCTAARSSLVWQWAGLPPQSPRAAEPWPLSVEADIHGDGGGIYRAWEMPPRHPTDAWAAITGAPCPVPSCGQRLVWWEAGYVPGYRVCMARRPGGEYDVSTLRHRFCLSTGGGWVLILEE